MSNFLQVVGFDPLLIENTTPGTTPGPAGPAGPQGPVGPSVSAQWAPSVPVKAGQLLTNNGTLYSVNADMTTPSSFTTTGLTVVSAAHITVNNGTGSPYISREIIDPNQTESKWREVFTAGSFNTHPDPVMFIGWNANKAAGGGDAAAPSLYMGFEADYWDTASNRTMEWYIGVVRADSSGPAFRPFAFTAARDSNLDLAASVQVDIGNNANGSARSRFDVIAGNGLSIFTVTPTSVVAVKPITVNNAGGYISVASGGIQANTTSTDNGHIVLNTNGVAKWYLANFNGDAAHYLWDATGGRFMTRYVSGTSVNAALMEINATPKLNGTQVTTATAGTAAALPATPQGYFQIQDSAGVTRKVPYYV